MKIEKQRFPTCFRRKSIDNVMVSKQFSTFQMITEDFKRFLKTIIVCKTVHSNILKLVIVITKAAPAFSYFC